MPATDSPPPDREAADRALGAVLGVLTRRGPSGPTYSDDDLRLCLALLFVQTSGRLQKTPGVIQNAGAAARLLGIGAKDAGAVVEQKILAQAGKLPAALRQDLANALRELVVAGSAGKASARVADLIGGAASNRPVGSEPAAAGSVRGALGARLTGVKTAKKTKKKK